MNTIAATEEIQTQRKGLSDNLIHFQNLDSVSEKINNARGI